MRVYSSSFFHFVKDFNTLKGIIKNGFNVYYCKEEIYSTENSIQHIGIPMVSFCDVPLNFMTQNNYGSFGIGMSRSWGIEHLLQPVMYYPNNKECLSTKLIIKATDNFLKHPEKPDDYSILGYSKPIKKIEVHSDRNTDNYIEREWRKVYKSYGTQRWKTEAEYKEYRGDSSTPKKQVGASLKFDVNDIDCIILKKKHINSFIDFVMDSNLTYFGDKQKVIINQRDRELMLSKIIQYENLVVNL